ncbi:MAG: isoprenylcysteine carboxyl methyltransferase [Euryarchaeota archaeon]|nr:isoprenylcysteine carboxyl methyltransferase [Euryarchaeota archaeon]
MDLEGSPAAVLLSTVAILGVVRVVELGINRGHEQRLLARGAVRQPHDGLMPIVVAQMLLFAGLILEGIVFPPETRLTPSTWVLLGVAAAALAVRHWCIRVLGDHWTIHVMTVPGAKLILRGPYRFLRHPNYLAVAVEAMALTLAFQLWITTFVVFVVGAPALLYRILREEAALRPFRAGSNVSQEAS